MSEPTYGATAQHDQGAHDDSQVVDGYGDDVQVVDDLDEGPLDGMVDGMVDGTDGGPVDVPQPPQTGDAGVDDAVALLRDAVAGPLDGQVAAYDAVHRALQDRLADVEG
ncbi:hypothetical protein [Kineosporia sp. R_H_3]|uniref:hypothetical protein n=1 Tax=Kineosporia sp. R_H_3 TaxID=1961848 RepID=UPI000B4B0CEF|nr:hypothetical protein [Kineosporia sp. R_H_3]